MKSGALRQALGVYLVLDLDQVGTRAERLVADALDAGVTAIQLRDKRGSMAAVERLAQAFRSKLGKAGVLFIVNDRLDVALGVAAEGVHIGQSDESLRSVRTRAALACRAELMVGVSVSTVAEAEVAWKGGASYLSVSPLFGTPSKADASKPAGLEGLSAIRRSLRDAPLVAIGGIRREHVADVIEAGADGVAFVSAASHARSPRSEMRAIAVAVRDAKNRGAFKSLDGGVW